MLSGCGDLSLCRSNGLRFVTDKQQEIDVPTLKVEDTDANGAKQPSSDKSKREPPMSQISGVRRLRHMNSFTGTVPKFGVPAVDDEGLKAVST